MYQNKNYFIKSFCISKYIHLNYMYLYLIIPTWYLYHTIEYCYHKLGHSRIYGSYIYKLHMNHHRIHYPITQLKAPEPYKGGDEYYFTDGIVAYLPPSLLIAFMLYILLDFYIFLFITLEIICIAGVSDYIHTQIHTEKSWLEKYKWFRESRRIHFIHHRRLHLNYSFAGLDYSIDRLCDTLQT